MGATRLIRRGAATVISVPRARLKVTRGPDKGRKLELGGIAPVVIGSDPDADLVLADDTVSQLHAEIRATVRGYVVRDLGSTNGVFVGDVRVVEAVLDGPRKIRLGESELEWKLAGDEVEHALAARPFGRLIGESEAMRGVYAILEQAAPSESTVLIEGESGTGKEVVAESLHRASKRAEGPFVVVDCASLAPSLVESELFGHERGAFTGADRARTGALAEAHGGTLFLDEIGELPLELQAKLLRALEAREVRPLGAARARSIDVRVVAATHRRLERLVAEGKFRGDLYYRLAVIKVRLPSLRHRTGDLLPLARHFLQQLAPAADPERLLDVQVAAALAAYEWPGNLRELRNVIERLALVGDLASQVRKAPPPGAYHEARQAAIDRFEREYCRAVVEHAGGVVKAAEHAGISRQMLHRLMKKHSVDG